MIPIWKALFLAPFVLALGIMIGTLIQDAVIDRLVDDLRKNKRILVKLPGHEFFIKKTKGQT